MQDTITIQRPTRLGVNDSHPFVPYLRDTFLMNGKEVPVLTTEPSKLPGSSVRIVRRAVQVIDEEEGTIRVVLYRKNRTKRVRPDGSTELAKVRHVTLSGQVKILWKDQ